MKTDGQVLTKVVGFFEMKRRSREYRVQTLEQSLRDAFGLAENGQFSFLRTERLQECARLILYNLNEPQAAQDLVHVLGRLSSSALPFLLRKIVQQAAHREATVSRHNDGRNVTEEEQCSALKILEVLCLVSKGTREDAANAGALEVLLDKLEGDVVDGTLAGACLDALLALLADSESNQQKFSELGGLQKVCLVLLNQHSPSCQILCCKAINLMVTHILMLAPPSARSVLETHMGSASAALLATPIAWTDRSLMEERLQNLATSALAKLPTD